MKITLTTSGIDNSVKLKVDKTRFKCKTTAGQLPVPQFEIDREISNYYVKMKEMDDADFRNFVTSKKNIDLGSKMVKTKIVSRKNNEICGKLRKGANFAAAMANLRPQKTTMTD